MRISPQIGAGCLRALGSIIAPSGRFAPLSILVYHRVLPSLDPVLEWEVSAPEFREQVALMKKCFNLLPLGEAVENLRRGELPSRAVCITFDDGYADNVEIALPILRDLEVPATFFIATGFLDGGCMWNDTMTELVRQMCGNTLDLRQWGLGMHPIESSNDRSEAIQKLLSSLKYLPHEERNDTVSHIASAHGTDIPDTLMMRSEQIKELHQAGMEIGGHTATHPILLGMNESTARAEIAEGKETLEGILGEKVRLFAYPNGKPNQDYDGRHVSIVRNLGMSAAVSTAWGVGTTGCDCYQLPRFTPWDRSPIQFCARLVRNFMNRTPMIAKV